MIGTMTCQRWTAPLSRPFVAAAATTVTMGLMLLPVASLSRGAPDSFANLASKLSPAVVNISTTQVLKGDKKGQPEFMVPRGSPFEEFFKEYLERNRPKNRGRRRATSLGSGFIIDKSGLVVTNNHVIAEADEISVRLSDGTRLKAKLVGKDAKTDLALLKVVPKKELPSLNWGNSENSRVGDWVLAIGNPFGLGGSVWSTDVAAANALAQRIQSGTVWVNRHMDITGAPFGGFKWSGVGRELGKADLDTFSESQTLMLAK